MHERDTVQCQSLGPIGWSQDTSVRAKVMTKRVFN